MHHNTLLIGTVLIFTAIGLGYATIPSYLENQSNHATQIKETKTELQVESNKSNAETAKNDTPVLLNDTDTQPTPTLNSYTLADVALHDSEENCWTAINGSVYDLTTYVEKHPGGKKNVLRICGVDGTEAFEYQHGGERRPENTLEDYYIGSLN